MYHYSKVFGISCLSVELLHLVVESYPCVPRTKRLPATAVSLPGFRKMHVAGAEVAVEQLAGAQVHFNINLWWRSRRQHRDNLPFALEIQSNCPPLSPVNMDRYWGCALREGRKKRTRIQRRSLVLPKSISFFGTAECPFVSDCAISSPYIAKWFLSTRTMLLQQLRPFLRRRLRRRRRSSRG